MLLSVIIPAHNEEKIIGKCLLSLKNQKTKDVEIILVNDGSTDKTREIAEKIGICNKIISFERGHSAAFARNRGAETAKGMWLIFIDADQVVEKNFFEKIFKFLKKEKIDGSDYLVYSYRPKTILQKAWQVYRKYYPSVGFPHIIRKDVFMELGGYNENIFYYEDGDLKERFLMAGYKFKGHVDVKVYHVEPENWKDFVRQRKWQGKGILSVLKVKKKLTVLRYFAPILLLPLGYFSFVPLLIYFIYFWAKFSIKTKEYINSLLWVLLDYIGRFISLFYLIKVVIL